jgi:hypothetical protein
VLSNRDRHLAGNSPLSGFGKPARLGGELGLT